MQASNVITSPIYLFLGFSIPPDKISFFNWNLFFSLRLFLFIFIEKHGYVMQSEYFGSCQKITLETEMFSLAFSPSIS